MNQDAVWGVSHLNLSSQSLLRDYCTTSELHSVLLVFFRNKHIMIDLGTGNNNKINWTMEDKQEMIDIVETVYRGARKGRGLVVSPKDYSTKYRYWFLLFPLPFLRIAFFPWYFVTWRRDYKLPKSRRIFFNICVFASETGQYSWSWLCYIVPFVF